MLDGINFSSLAGLDRVDAENGIIFGASVITQGEAAGGNAGTWIDQTTLAQIHAICSKSPEGIKVKLSQAKEHDGSAGQIVGAIKNTRFDGPRLRGDIHLLKSDANFPKIIEMAQKMASQFGLSIVSPKDGFSLETNGDKKLLRCSQLSSIDIVEAPAANQGLFFSTTTKTNMSIKYAKGDSGDHANDCDCKECMSKHSKKEMSAYLAGLLGLSAGATDSDIQAAFSKVGKPTDVSALTTKLQEHEVKLSQFQAANANGIALSQKAEIDNLMAEAAKAGQVVPLENDDLYTMKDGTCTIHTEPAKLQKMLSKLPKGQLRLSKQSQTSDKSPAFKTANERIEFCRNQREAGAAQLTAQFAAAGLVNLN